MRSRELARVKRLAMRGLQLAASNSTAPVAPVTSSASVSWDDVTSKPSVFTPDSHTHDQSEVTNLVSDLAGKASTSHTHTASQITDFDTAADARVTAGITGKQDTLVSATNIKTVNGSSLLGSGNLTVSSGYHSVTTLASDAATAANTTPISLSGMSFSFDANSIYFIRVIGTISSAAATTGAGFHFDVSAAVTQIAGTFFHQLANTGTVTGGSTTADDTSLGVSSGVPTLNVAVPVVFIAMIRTGANTGTAQLRYRSETTAVTTAKAGMTMVVEKVA